MVFGWLPPSDTSELPGYDVLTEKYGINFDSFANHGPSSPEESAQSVPDPGTVPDYHKLYQENRDWAEAMAQRQMDFQTEANRVAMDFSAKQAEIARHWEREMSNTAYRRAVADLKAAGLNPVLAYSNGPASTPSVAAASGVTSSGSKATMADIGYAAAQLDFDYVKMIVNAAVDIIGDLTSLAPTTTIRKVVK